MSAERQKEPVHIGKAFDQHGLEAMCQRVTGKTLGEWQAEFAKRRRRMAQSGELSTGRTYAIEDLRRFFSAGLELEDFEAFRCPHDKATRWRLRRDKYPVL